MDGCWLDAQLLRTVGSAPYGGAHIGECPATAARVKGADLLAAGFAVGRSMPTAVLRRILGVLERKPTAGWALRRGQLVHGAADPIQYLRALRDYSLKDRAGQITCPVFVCNADGDDISKSAPQLAEALTGAKEFVTFTAAEGAGDHCEAGARTLYHAIVRLARPRPARGPAALRPSGSLISASPKRPGRHRLLRPQLLLAVRRQQLRRHPEVVTGDATQRNAVNRTVGTGQREAVSDLGRNLAFRAGYDSQHVSHLLMGAPRFGFPHRCRAGPGRPDTSPAG